MFDLGHHAEGFEHAGSLSGKPARQRGCGGVADRLLQCRGVNTRMLANIERVEMKAEGAHLEDERIDERARDADSVVLFERRAQRLQVIDKFLDGAIGRQYLRQLVLAARERVGRDGKRFAGAWRLRRLLQRAPQRALDARLDADDEAAIVLELILRAEDLPLRRVHLRHVSFEPVEQLLGSPAAAARWWSAGR